MESEGGVWTNSRRGVLEWSSRPNSFPTVLESEGSGLPTPFQLHWKVKGDGLDESKPGGLGEALLGRPPLPPAPLPPHPSRPPSSPALPPFPFSPLPCISPFLGHFSPLLGSHPTSTEVGHERVPPRFLIPFAFIAVPQCPTL